MSQSSPSCLSCLCCQHTRRILLAIVLTADTFLDIILITVYMHLPGPVSVTLRAVLTCPKARHHTRHHTRHVLFAIILAAGLITILLIVVVLITLCSLRFAHCVVLITLCSLRPADCVVS